MKEYYAIKGPQGCADLLKNRTANACVCRARILGLNSVQKWTAEDNTVLREHYATDGPQGCAVLLNHSKAACIRQAAVLGLARKKEAMWTPEEESFFKKPAVRQRVYNQQDRNNACRRPNA